MNVEQNEAEGLAPTLWTAYSRCPIAVIPVAVKNPDVYIFPLKNWVTVMRAGRASDSRALHAFQRWLELLVQAGF